jgi:Na+/H+-dicarboxylate symporter
MPLFHKRLSLSSQILLGLILGVSFGLFIGEYAGRLFVVGEVFIGLLQMTVLPYIILAIIINIGRLSPSDGKKFGVYVAIFLCASVITTLAAIVLLPLGLPDRESASFFSSSTLESPAEIDFLQLFIPSNPFFSLANNIVPAVVIFCVASGAAIMKLTDKNPVLEQLDFLMTALSYINRFIMKLTPIGVFAIVASMAGTLRLEELLQMKAYFFINLVASLLLGFGVLMILLAALTPFTYGEIFRVSRTPMITAFVTGKVFIVLPMIITAAEELFEKHVSDPAKPASYARCITPLAYPFPHAGKLLALLFIPFAGWFVDMPLVASDYPTFLGAGVFSLFGSPVVAMPFLLDMFQLPADLFQLFIASGVLVSRLGDMLGAMHLLFVSVLSAAALSGLLQLNLRKLLFSISLIIVLCTVTAVGSSTYLANSLSEEYTKDEIVKNMHSAIHSSPAVVHRSVPRDMKALDKPVLNRIAEKEILRIGYHPDNLPMSFFNTSGELVGYDIDMAHLLAGQMGCELEFVPFEHSTLPEQLNRGEIDIAMSGLTMLPTRLTMMSFSDPYMNATGAIVIRDHRREEFKQRIADGDFTGIKLAFARSSDISKIGSTLLPGAEFVQVSSLRQFCEDGGDIADGMIWSAESGSAWTLLYPEFSVVPVIPLYQVPVGYAVSQKNTELADFVSQWLKVVKAGPADERLYDHWILGKNSTHQETRWSVIRDVLHWVD